MGEENNQLYYYHGDHLGGAQIVTDPEGKIYEQLEYTPYGELWVEHVPTVEAMPFRFTGKERDGPLLLWGEVLKPADEHVAERRPGDGGIYTTCSH
jgi:hypothetical protein